MIERFLLNNIGEYLFYLVSLLTAITAIIPLLVKQGQIYNRKYKPYKRIRWAGYLIIFTSSLGIYINDLQNTFNDIKNEQKENALRNSIKKDYNSSIDTMQKRFVDGNKEIIKSVINSLGSYGYKMDSANSKLVKIVRDSSKTRIIVPDDPVVILCENTGITIDSSMENRVTYKVRICSNDASSTNFSIVFRVVTEDSLGNLRYLGTTDLLRKDMRMAKEKVLISQFGILRSIPQSTMYLSMKGTYQNYDMTKSFSINELYMYEVKKKNFHMATNDLRERILSFISKEK